MTTAEGMRRKISFWTVENPSRVFNLALTVL